MSTDLLKASERLRVRLALTGRLRFDLTREEATKLIRDIEEIERASTLIQEAKERQALAALETKKHRERVERQANVTLTLTTLLQLIIMHLIVVFR